MGGVDQQTECQASFASPPAIVPPAPSGGLFVGNDERRGCNTAPFGQRSGAELGAIEHRMVLGVGDKGFGEEAVDVDHRIESLSNWQNWDGAASGRL